MRCYHSLIVIQLVREGWKPQKSMFLTITFFGHSKANLYILHAGKSGPSPLKTNQPTNQPKKPRSPFVNEQTEANTPNRAWPDVRYRFLHLLLAKDLKGIYSIFTFIILLASGQGKGYSYLIDKAKNIQ